MKIFQPLSCFFLVLFAVSNCNIEVGNPEPELYGVAAPVHALSLGLASQSPCEITGLPCTSVPVMVSESGDSKLTYELTQVQFQLAGLQLQPFAEEGISASVDLLTGASVVFPTARDSRDVQGVALRFNTAKTPAVPSLYLYGDLRGTYNGQRIAMPLAVTYNNEFLTQAAVSVGNEVIVGVVFDTDLWFDFKAAPHEADRIIKGLTDGACRTSLAESCLKYRENLARQISEKISQSMSVKTRPTGKKTDPKAKNAG